jgi:PKHD-type hydroxylase
MNALHLKAVLQPDELQAVVAAVAARPFADGADTAAAIARRAKHNREIVAGGGDTAINDAARLVERGLRRNPFFRAWTLPKRLTNVIFNRYEQGMSYGDHTDNALGESPQLGYVRLDLAFTVFLSDPASYDGGELVINSDSESQSIKLPAGDAVIYLASTIHRVNEVRRGARAAAVGWVESLVRDVSQRQILFDLQVALEQAYAARITVPGLLTLLEKCRGNLMRMWADI